MSKYVRYSGSFVSVSGVVWKAEIRQEAPSKFSEIKDLDFDIDALTIEWPNKSKEEAICGSIATLRIVSPGDRTYADLYSIEPGRVCLDIYRNGVRYWRGSLDTEFYEEPYEQARGYVVTLTFSDFGVLGRYKYSLTGKQALYSIVVECLAKAGIVYPDIVDTAKISTYIGIRSNDSKPLALTDLSIRSDNFYDEDGEACTLAEALEGVLQPLALKIVQYAGHIYVYDINGLYKKSLPALIEWSGDSQTMGVDRVYNNAVVTWSPYADEGNRLPELCWPEDLETPATLTALNVLDMVTAPNGSAYLSYHYTNNIDIWGDKTDCGFTLWLSDQGKGATIVNKAAKFFRIVPQYDGNEAEGIAVHWTAYKGWREQIPGGYSSELQTKAHGIPTPSLYGFPTSVGGAIYKTESVWLPPIDRSSDYLIRVAMELLFDPRFNPFEEAANLRKKDNKQAEYYKNFEDSANFVYVPVLIKFSPDGINTYVWDNRDIVRRDVVQPVTEVSETYGRWVKYTETEGRPNNWGWLCYYDPTNRADASGVLGWKTNRPAINPHLYTMRTALANAELGQCIPYPPGGEGNLTVEVLEGSWQICNGGETMPNILYNNVELWGVYSGILLKLPEVEVVYNRQFDQELAAEDVEYRAELNSYAKETINIDTICGTSSPAIPTARGAYYLHHLGGQASIFTRGPLTSQVEELLIGTLYSQYAERHTKLSGERYIGSEPLTVYSENNQGDKLFMLVGEVQRLREDVSDAEFIEIRPDEYTKKN